MRCPTCGSGPVMIHGSQWECGFCGDTGILRQSVSEPEELEVSLSFSLVFDPDLLRNWQDMKDALIKCAPKSASELYPLLIQALIYEISRALIEGNRTLPEEKEAKLRDFFGSVADIREYATVDKLLQDAQKGRPIYSEIGRFDETVCAKFWTSLIESMAGADLPDAISDLCYAFGTFREYFLSDELCDEGMDHARLLEQLIENRFYGEDDED